METGTLSALANVGQASAGIIALGAYLPQIVKLWRAKSTGSISIMTWGIWLLSSSLAAFYAVVQWLIHGTGVVLVVTALAVLGLELATFALLVRYRRTPAISGKKRRRAAA